MDGSIALLFLKHVMRKKADEPATIGPFLVTYTVVYIKTITEYFGAQEVDICFLNNIFNLKGNCVLRTLKNSFAIF